MFATVNSSEPITAHFVPAVYQHLQKIVIKEETKDSLLGVVSKDGEEIQLKQVGFKPQSEMEDIFKLTEEQLKKRMNTLIKTVFSQYSEE